MANFYGPMQYRPNPSGLTLNSNPMPWTPPAAPAVQQNPNAGILSYADWRAQDGHGWKNYWRRPIHGDRGSRSDGAPVGMAMGRQRDAYDRYVIDSIAGGGMLGGVGAPSGGLSLDSSAASYANFLNGRG
jgi:hypothetical protein